FARAARVRPMARAADGRDSRERAAGVMLRDGAWRNASGGRIDRTRPIAFTFNGTPLRGFEGDTLASALLANGIRVCGRSFKYHRPGGIIGAGYEEAGTVVQLAGADDAPNWPATRVRLRDGLVASSVHCWPSVGFDALAAIELFSAWVPAGF